MYHSHPFKNHFKLYYCYYNNCLFVCLFKRTLESFGILWKAHTCISLSATHISCEIPCNYRGLHVTLQPASCSLWWVGSQKHKFVPRMISISIPLERCYSGFSMHKVLFIVLSSQVPSSLSPLIIIVFFSVNSFPGSLWAWIFPLIQVKNLQDIFGHSEVLPEQNLDLCAFLENGKLVAENQASSGGRTSERKAFWGQDDEVK